MIAVAIAVGKLNAKQMSFQGNIGINNNFAFLKVLTASGQQDKFKNEFKTLKCAEMQEKNIYDNKKLTEKKFFFC